MPDSLGPFLRQLRRTRRLSQNQAAALAGIHRATLNRWEAGRFQPRLPELQSLLQSLAASNEQRARAIALLEAPRAALASAESRERGQLIGSGSDLLRAMRLRRGLPLNFVAPQVGVTRSTLSRWERGETWPDGERLSRLCGVLGAGKAELCALIHGRFSLAPTGDAMDLEAQIAALSPLLMHGEYDPLADLRVLGLIARLRSGVETSLPSSAVAFQLRRLQSDYSHYLFLYGRYREALDVASWVLEHVGEKDDTPLPHHGRALVNTVRAAAQVRGAPAYREGVDLLKAWTPMVRESPLMAGAYLPWILEMKADLLSRDGHAEEALRCMRESQLTEQRYRDFDAPSPESQRCMARLLARAGRRNEALMIIEDTQERCRELSLMPQQRISMQLMHAEVLLDVGDATQAHDRLQSVYRAIENSRFAYLMRQADLLAAKLADAPIAGDQSA